MSEQQTTQKTTVSKPVATTEPAVVAPVDDQTALIGVMRSLGDDQRRLTPAQGALLQRTLGNRATGLLLRNGNSAEATQAASSRSLAAIQGRIVQLGVQAKLTVGPVDDPYEKEADAVAKQVVQRINRQEDDDEIGLKRLQRQEDEDELGFKRISRQEDEEELGLKRLMRQEEDELAMKRIQRDVAAPGDPMLDGGEVSSDIEASIRGAKGGGSPLSDTIRKPMESAFDADFSGVKVHTDSRSDALNQAVSAKAFTTGSDVFFRSGEYDPGSSAGQELIAHELTHVVQQGGSAARKYDDVLQRDIWDYLPSWGSTTTSGEAMDTTSASLEAADEAQKAAKSLEASSLLAEGSKLKAGSDAVGSVGGAISGAKDMGEAYEEGVGVQSGLKMVGGVSGLTGGVVKGADAFGGEHAKALLESVATGGGETIGGWLDFISGGTKALSGIYLTGKSQLYFNRIKSVFGGSAVPEVKSAAQQLMDIVNERWWLGMWDIGIGSLDMAATTTIPGYVAAAKATGAVSKMIGGDIIWKTISYASGGRIRSNDDLDEQINAKVDTLSGAVSSLVNAALLANEVDQLKALYQTAQAFAPEFAEALSSAVRMARVNGLPVGAGEMRRRKQLLKGVVWE